MRIEYQPGTLGTQLPLRAHFLEHATLPSRLPEVLVGDGDGRVHRSNDGGKQFSAFSQRFRRSVSKCFSLRNGNRLVRLKDSLESLLCGPEFEPISNVAEPAAEWHGSWSIAESEPGTVVFGEYLDRAAQVRVWRSEDGGRTFHVVLQLHALAAEPQIEAQLRHFHTCTWLGGKRWVVSSGDETRHCRVWLSEDDALSWTEIREWRVTGADIPERYQPSILRHTAELWDGPVAYWVTDDLLRRGRAAFVRANLQTREIAVLADLGGNEMRTLVRHGESFVAISEVKHQLDRAEVYILARDGRVLCQQSVPNPRRQKLSFTRSRSSLQTEAGVFFTFDDGVVSEQCRFVRWQIHE